MTAMVVLCLSWPEARQLPNSSGRPDLLEPSAYSSSQAAQSLVTEQLSHGIDVLAKPNLGHTKRHHVPTIVRSLPGAADQKAGGAVP